MTVHEQSSRPRHFSEAGPEKALALGRDDPESDGCMSFSLHSSTEVGHSRYWWVRFGLDAAWLAHACIILDP